MVASCSKREGGEAAAGFFSFCSRPIEELIRHSSFADLRSSFGQQVLLSKGEGGVRLSEGFVHYLRSCFLHYVLRSHECPRFEKKLLTASVAAASTVAPRHSMSPNVEEEEEEGIDDDGCSLMFLVFYLVLCD